MVSLSRRLPSLWIVTAALVASPGAARPSTPAAFVSPVLREGHGAIRAAPAIASAVADDGGSTALPAHRCASFAASGDGEPSLPDRRSILASVGTAAAAASLSLLLPAPALAADVEPYERRGKDFAWSLAPPPGFEPGNKPLKTHLDEVNFSLEGTRGYQYGITVDPVRIDSLRQFGTPEEVAARVVTAEVNRDGIFEVKLAKDPLEDEASGSYVFEYVSDGKRGKKRFVTKIFIRGQKLYVLTAQSKEEEYDGGRETEMAEVVRTFRLL